MADKNIKKVIIPPENLLAINVPDDPLANTSQYFVRYRVVSEDKTRTSAWSPIYKVRARTVPDILNGQTVNYSIFSNGDRITLNWTPPNNLKISTYDIYVQWKDGAGTATEYAYAGTSSTNSFNVAVLAGKQNVRFWIQAATFPKIKSQAALLVETAYRSTAYVISGGSIV